MASLIFIIYIGTLGLIIGSFFGALEYRIKSQKPGIFFGRSLCPYCNRVIKTIHLVPIIGYLLQKGRCEHCHKKISEKYLIIELTTATAFVLVATTNMKIPELTSTHLQNLLEFLQINTHLFTILFSSTVLIFLAYYDALHKIVLDRIAIPAIIILIILIPYNQNLTYTSAFEGAIIATSFFLFQIIISRGRWLGGGDLRISAIIGLTLGTALTITALFLSYLLGAIINLPKVFKGQSKQAVAFAPYLAAGTIITLIWGNKILNWYLNLI